MRLAVTNKKNKVMKKVLLSIVLLMAATAVFSQPRVNDDGTVTFRYKNDSAKVVMVDVNEL